MDPMASASVFRGLTVAATTFGLVFPAETDDKTQRAVAGMVGTLPVFPVWISATLLLGTTSALGVVVGQKLLRCIPLRRLHQLSGVFFLIRAAFAPTRVFPV